MAVPIAATAAIDFDVETIERNLTNAIGQALYGVAGALFDRVANPNGEPLPAPMIDKWPIKSHPPVVIAPCPHCGDAIEANPVVWEIIIDPTATTDSTTVRGQMQHEHDGGVLVRWPFVATYTPTRINDEWEPIDAPVIWDDPDVDLDEGQQKVDDPWAFTPDGEGEVSLAAAVFQALGGASTCWDSDEPDRRGVFDGTRAREIGDALLAFIGDHIERDERIQAWEHVTKHPYLRPAYDTERTLLAAILERLDEGAGLEAERVRLDQIIYRARTLLSEAYPARDSVHPESLIGRLRATLDAVDGIDSPRAKSLRRDRRA